jgi:LysR family transcriptional regulator, nitrogen assimilation regulatory protein
MDIRQLRYFVAITESGSFSQAAQKLFVSQPSLSQQIAGLETELKTQLLLRSAQGVAPTPAGSLLYRRSKELLRQVEQIKEEIHLENGLESGPVSVGLPTTIASVLGLPLFTRIRKRFTRR